MSDEPDPRNASATQTQSREPSEEEISLGIDYLHQEPMREYEENKNKPADGESGGRGGRGRGAMGPNTLTAKPEMPEDTDGAAGADGETPAAPAMGMGMMGGMGGRGGRGGAPETKYQATAWGRYIKVLLSASEFVFIN